MFRDNNVFNEEVNNVNFYEVILFKIFIIVYRYVYNFDLKKYVIFKLGEMILLRSICLSN